MPSADVLILGAGISGLMAGRTLAQAGIRAVIVDKARGVGGRMATRRLESGLCDQGAQFFTVKSRDFRPILDEGAARGLVERWSDGFPDAENKFPAARHSRFRAVPSMTAIPKWLAQDQDVRFPWKVTSVQHDGNQWRVTNEAGDTLHANALFLSAPLPQALALLETGGVTLPSAEAKDLLPFAYHPCFSLLVRLSGDSRVPEPGGFYPFLEFDHEPLAWIADNWKKGVSPGVTTLTILGGHDFSRRYFDAPAEEVERKMLDSAAPWLGSPIVEKYLHRWRYSEPVRPFPEAFRRSALPQPLYFIGDAFGGSRVEGAALSGILAARDYASSASQEKRS